MPTSLDWRGLFQLSFNFFLMKQASFLLMNDIHVSKDNISEFQDNWNEALEICKSQKIKEIIVGGDMFQSRSSQTLDVLLAVKHALIQTRYAGVRVTIAEGNHDLVNQESCDGYNQVFSEYDMVDVISDYAIIEVSDDIDLFVMSYFPENGSFVERYNDMVKTDLMLNKKNILYLHEGIRGGLSTPSDDELPATMFKQFDCVLVGHYHNRKKIPGTNIEYIGSSRQHNFGEDEEKGYTILYNDGSYQFVRNNVNTRYKVIDVMNISQLNENVLKYITELKNSGKYKIKLRIQCKSSEASMVDKQKLVELGVTKIEFVTEDVKAVATASQGLEKKFDKNGIKEEYSSFCADHGVSNVEIGLYYLGKIK